MATRYRTAKRGKPSEAGLTLIECIAAIVVVSLVGAVIAPAMVVSVATRVQSQKADQALKIAQGEIDRVRAYAERVYVEAMTAVPQASPAYVSDLTAVSAPSSMVASCPSTDVSKACLLDIDPNNDETNDQFAIQVFRANPKFRNNSLIGFDIGVRVYDGRVDFQSISKDQASLGLTAGEGERVNKPLAVLYSNVIVPSGEESLCEYVSGTTKTAISTCN